MINADPKTVAGFGEEWSYFPQTEIDRDERQRAFDAYFSIFPWHRLPANACGADVGCGSGRWAAMVASRVGKLHLVDASVAALEVARAALTATSNLEFHHASVDAMPLKNGSLDFAYSLGVLHHVPDTAGAIRSIASKLKTGAPFLIYLYYAFDNRPAWYRMLWNITNAMRRVISKTPFVVRIVISSVLAALVYLPLAKMGGMLERTGLMPANWPLGYYRDKSFYTMRTDALDRFGTRLEHRFSRREICVMLESAGFVEIRFSEAAPYWCAVGFKGNRSTEA
ncbi:MAG TPA: class I SAM-dependent methyltransferase [Candidatus Binataceae bacterium]|nr:class I SAM-dependent methyltransferase [Candidatus Binataceae bacterium]